MSLLDTPIAPRPMRHFVTHNHAIALTPVHVPGCDACCVASMLAAGLNTEACPYAYADLDLGWLECSQQIAHTGDCTPV